MKITSLEEFFTVYNPDYINTIICSSNRMRAFRDEFGMPDPDNFWLWREWIRLWTEDYTKIPVSALNVNQLTVDYPETRFHFLHVAKSSPGLIAFTESPEHGKQDRQSVMKLGKYLCRYAPNYDPRFIVAEYIRILTPPELKFARTREEIRRVYDEGPQSCMKHKRIGAWDPNNNYEEISPVEVYAGPDTSVAYIGDYKIREGVKARTVINERNKSWIRLYGDDYQLKDLLRNAGFSFGGDLCGCRVLYFRQDKYDDRPVMPYLDGDCNQCCVYDDNYITIAEDGDWKCNEQNGTVNPGDPDCTCDYCGDECDEEDTTYVESTDQRVCERCLARNFTHAYTGRYAEYVCNDDTDTYEYNGQYYTEDGLDYHDLVIIEGEVYRRDEVVDDFIDDETIPLEIAIEITTDGNTSELTHVDNISVHVLDNIYFDLDEMKVWHEVEYEDAIANNLTSLDELLSAHPEIDYVWDTFTSHPYGYNAHLFCKAIINAIASQVRQLENEHRILTQQYLQRINPPRVVEELRSVTRPNILSDAYALAA